MIISGMLFCQRFQSSPQFWFGGQSILFFVALEMYDWCVPNPLGKCSGELLQIILQFFSSAKFFYLEVPSVHA